MNDLPASATSQKTKAAVDKTVNKDQKEIEANTTIASVAQRRAEAGVFWTELLSDPLGKLKSEIEEALPGDGPAQSLAKDLLSGLQSGRFDPESSLAAYANSSAPTGYSGPSVISGMSDGNPVSSMGLARSGKQGNGPTECTRNMIISTVSTAAKMVVGAAGPALQGVGAFHAMLGAVQAQYENFFSALMLMPVETLSVFMVDKNTLLDQLREYVEKAYKVIQDLDEDDYGFDHHSVIRDAIALLQEAASDTATVESVLLQGGAFLEDSWDRAEDKVSEASKLIIDTSLEAPLNQKQLRLVGYLSGVSTTIQVLLCRQSIIERIYNNMATFAADIEVNAKWDNMFGPIVDQVSCLLRAIIADMEASLNKNSALSLYAREQKWYIELRAILTFMENAEQMLANVPDLATTVEFSASFEEDASEDNNTNDFTALVNLVNEFKAQARGALTQLLANPIRVQRIVEAVYVEIDRQKGITSRIDEKLKKYTSQFGGSTAEAITVASGIVNFAKSRNLLGIVQALKEGDLKGVLSNAFNTTPEEEALGGVVGLIAYAKVSLPEEVDALQQSYEVLRGRVRGEELFKSLITGSSDKYIRERKEKRLPENNGLLRTIERVVDKTGTTATDILDKIKQVQDKIDVVSGKIDEGAAQVVGLVTRPTQQRPISCSSR